MAKGKGSGVAAALAGVVLAGVAFAWWARQPKTSSRIIPEMPDFSTLPINSQTFPSLGLGTLVMPMPDWSNLPINAQPPMPYVAFDVGGG